MILLIILAIIIWLCWPLIRVAWSVYMMQRRVKQAFNQAAGTGEYSSRQSAGSNRPRRRRKIIDKNVGEYVEFEEIPTYNNPSDDTTYYTEISYNTESQIEDAEWEDE